MRGEKKPYTYTHSIHLLCIKTPLFYYNKKEEEEVGKKNKKELNFEFTAQKEKGRKQKSMKSNNNHIAAPQNKAALCVR